MLPSVLRFCGDSPVLRGAQADEQGEGGSAICNTFADVSEKRMEQSKANGVTISPCRAQWRDTRIYCPVHQHFCTLEISKQEVVEESRVGDGDVGGQQTVTGLLLPASSPVLGRAWSSVSLCGTQGCACVLWTCVFPTRSPLSR